MQVKLIFFEHLKNVFFPKLISLGFVEKEQIFRRATGAVINIINVQEHCNGDRCRINMGLHLEFLPASWARHSLKIGKLTPFDCEFQRCLTPASATDSWWPYRRWFQSPVSRAEKIMDAYLGRGETLFSHYKTTEDFTALFTPEDFQSGGWQSAPHGFRPQRGALTMARIHLHLGQSETAQAYARVGMALTSPNTALAAEYRHILETA